MTASREEILHAIIDRIRRNRISTTEVADCLGKSGALFDIRPVNSRHFAVGEVHWAYAHAESNWETHKGLRDAPDGSVAVIETFDCGARAPVGALVAKFLLLYRQCAAMVVDAPVRDASHLVRENWPIWSRGFSPIGCYNVEPDAPLDPELLAARRAHYTGAVAVCDDCGVIIIPHERITSSFLDDLDAIERMEDIWFDCIDRKKWDTFETVCLKRYQDEGDDT